MKSRQEHLEWCKQEACKNIQSGNLEGAMADFILDMRKHPKTEDHAALPLMLQLYMIGDLRTPESMRKFIDGFN